MFTKFYLAAYAEHTHFLWNLLDPVPRHHWPHRSVPLHRLPVPTLDALGADWLRHHLYHPLRELLLPDLPPPAPARGPHQGRQVCLQRRSQWGHPGGKQWSDWEAGGETGREREAEKEGQGEARLKR